MKKALILGIGLLLFPQICMTENKSGSIIKKVFATICAVELLGWGTTLTAYGIGHSINNDTLKQPLGWFSNLHEQILSGRFTVACSVILAGSGLAYGGYKIAEKNNLLPK